MKFLPTSFRRGLLIQYPSQPGNTNIYLFILFSDPKESSELRQKKHYEAALECKTPESSGIVPFRKFGTLFKIGKLGGANDLREGTDF